MSSYLPQKIKNVEIWDVTKIEQYNVETKHIELLILCIIVVLYHHNHMNWTVYDKFCIIQQMPVSSEDLGHWENFQ